VSIFSSALNFDLSNAEKVTLLFLIVVPLALGGELSLKKSEILQKPHLRSSVPMLQFYTAGKPMFNSESKDNM